MPKRPLEDVEPIDKRSRFDEQTADEEADWEALQELIKEETKVIEGQATEITNIELDEELSSDDDEARALAADYADDADRLEERMTEQQERRAYLDKMRRERDEKAKASSTANSSSEVPSAAQDAKEDEDDEDDEGERGWIARKM
jgi:hypothetical protein